MFLDKIRRKQCRKYWSNIIASNFEILSLITESGEEERIHNITDLPTILIKKERIY